MAIPTLTLREFFQRWLRWERGRQGTGYEKCLLLTGVWPLPFDLYLLRYRAAQGIPPHTDLVAGYRHFRANWVLWRQGEGGQFRCETPIFSRAGLHVFRSDLSTHAVEAMVRGSRYVLSLGWLRR